MINMTIVPSETAVNTKKPDIAPAAAPASGSQVSLGSATAVNKPVLAIVKSEQNGMQTRMGDGKKGGENVKMAKDDSTRFEVSTDEDTGQRVFKHVVASNGHVLWQYPEEDLLENAKEQGKSEGVYADLTA